MLNKWQDSLSQEDLRILTCDGKFDPPFMPSYSAMVRIADDHYEGRVGYGNGTEHHIGLFIDKGDWQAALYIELNGKRGKFSHMESLTIGIPWETIKERLKMNFAWDAHLLSVSVKKILNRVNIGLPPNWERPKGYW